MTSLGCFMSRVASGSDLFVSGGSKVWSHHRVASVSIDCCANGASHTNSLSNNHSLERNSKSTINKLESVLYPDKVVAEEKIERPVGLPVKGRMILNNPRCNECDTKGLVECATCTGSGLYVDSIMECQGIFVKVRCLGCGGSGNILCSTCGGRGHL